MKGGKRNTDGVTNPSKIKNTQSSWHVRCQVLNPQVAKIFLDDGENTLVIFSDMEPPRIKCPSVKERIAEPNKLTVRVSWDTPEGRDTADGILTE